MNSYWLKVIFHYIFLIFSVYLITFFLIRLVPGDPIDFLVGQSNFSADVNQIKEHLGLDLSIFEQVVKALKNLFQLDFGLSIHQNIDVLFLLKPALINTALLAILSVSMAVIIGIPLGLFISYLNSSFLNQITKWINAILIAIPSFILAPILILFFAIFLDLLPVSGMEKPSSILLPAATLSIGFIAYLVKMTMDSTEELKDSIFIIAAKSKGLNLSYIYFTHVIKLISLPIVTAIGLQLGGLLSGTIITEMIFSWNGIGKLLIDSIHQRDYPITQATVFFIAISYVTINFILEFIYLKLDPRIKTYHE